MGIPAKSVMADLFVGEKANWEQRWPIHSESTACTVADVFTSEQDATLFCAAPEMLAALDHAENELIRLRASVKQLAPIRAAIKKAKGE